MRNALVGLACIIWLVLVGAGLAKLWAYASAPGPAADASDRWPASSRLARDTIHPTLVMFLHPQCECSSASVGELARLMAHTQGRLTVRVVIYAPSNAAPGWERSTLWDAAASIPGVTVSSDPDAAEATRFGAYVSGQTLLYDEAGTLSFSGGMTFARGHAGDNEGSSAVLAIVNHDPPATRRTPVFGCFLREAPAA